MDRTRIGGRKPRGPRRMMVRLGALAAGGAVAAAAVLALGPGAGQQPGATQRLAGTVQPPITLTSTVQGPTIAVVIIGAAGPAAPAGVIVPPD